MNRQSPIYKALEERGRSQRLPLDFSFEVMSRILVEERRRKRRDMWWAIVGYAVAAIVTVFTLVYYCGDIFNETLQTTAATLAASKATVDVMPAEVVKSIGNSWTSSAEMLAILIPIAAILLAFDHFLRKKIAIRFKQQ